jgi:hypothetical protein
MMKGSGRAPASNQRPAIALTLNELRELAGNVGQLWFSDYAWTRVRVERPTV